QLILTEFTETIGRETSGVSRRSSTVLDVLACLGLFAGFLSKAEVHVAVLAWPASPVLAADLSTKAIATACLSSGARRTQPARRPRQTSADAESAGANDDDDKD